MSEPELILSARRVAERQAAWSRAVRYALAQTEKKWVEEGSKGEPNAEFFAQWLPYYLSLQWDFQMPPGGLFSVTE